MTGPESNKIFAAILIAGITAYLAAFVADKLIHPETTLETDAVAIEGGEVASAGPAQKAGPEPIMHLIATADIARGEKLSKACAACHSFDQGGPNKIGPNMWGVVGDEKGHIKDFVYSEALLEKGGDWNYDSLNKFLWKPKSYIPGTKMNYVGIKKPEDRAAMIAWLRTLGSSSYPLPSEADIAAEKAELDPEPEVAEDEAVDGAADTSEGAEADMNDESTLEPAVAN
ncbi:MAG: c-type cytochrome [Alphaproteobacteria bacterium]